MMKRRLVAIQKDRVPDVLDRGLVLAHLMGDESKEMPNIRVMGFNLQDPPVDLLGGVKSSRLVMFQSRRENFRYPAHECPLSR